MKKLILCCFIASLCACGNQVSNSVEDSDSIVVDTIVNDSILIVE